MPVPTHTVVCEQRGRAVASMRFGGTGAEGEPERLGIAGALKLDTDHNTARFSAVGFRPDGLAMGMIEPGTHVGQRAAERGGTDRNFQNVRASGDNLHLRGVSKLSS